MRLHERDTDPASASRSDVRRREAQEPTAQERGRDALHQPPLSVAELLPREGRVDDITVLVAAVLHDTIEDTENSRDELKDLFGPEVAVVVADVTDDKSVPKVERKKRQVEHASHLSLGAKLVKLADKISNVRDVADDPPKDWPLAQSQEYFDWAKSVVDRLRGVDEPVELKFDQLYTRRPR